MSIEFFAALGFALFAAAVLLLLARLRKITALLDRIAEAQEEFTEIATGINDKNLRRATRDRAFADEELMEPPPPCPEDLRPPASRA